MLGTILIGGITKATIGQIVGTAAATYGLNKLVFKPAGEAAKLYVDKKIDEVVDRATDRGIDRMADVLAKAMATGMNMYVNPQATETTPKG